MTLIVEDGTALANAESYASIATCTDYCTDRAYFTWNDISQDRIRAEAALRRATMYIDFRYRSRFTGYRRNLRVQALEWPRSFAFVDLGVLGQTDVDYQSVPREIVQATCEAAYRELLTPGSLNPDFTAYGTITMEKIGDLQVQYADVSALGAAGTRPVVSIIDGILGPLLLRNSNPFSGKVRRG